MRLKLFTLGLSALALLWFVPSASAGVIREAGKGIGKGSVAVAQTTASAAGTAADRAATVGKETPEAVRSGSTNVAKGAAAATRAGYHGTTAAAKKVWHVVW
jgi:hypothetical protein